jgi:hypothetical protein
VNIKDVIRAKKADLETGNWSNGRIPRSAFPLSKLKNRHYRFGPDYSWRLVRFSALGEQFRILIILNISKEILRARLGMEIGSDMTVLGEHEFHASEPGWHCHLTFENVADIVPGVVRFRKTKWPVHSAAQEFDITFASALTHVAKRFGFKEQGELL